MTTIDAVKIGQKLRAERTRRFLTQDALANKAGISRNSFPRSREMMSNRGSPLYSDWPTHSA